MISLKGSHNFWSQLLVSMIAIFALPATQSLDCGGEIRSESYQNQHQQIRQYITTAAFLRRQGQTQPVTSAGFDAPLTNLNEIRPHFYRGFTYRYAPIRAGPIVAV